MNKITDNHFLSTFPPALMRDKNMAALGKLIAKELHITAIETKKNIIYANIDTLSESCLDILAYDLHIDWYNYNYNVETKRAIIKDSIRVHQKLGTKNAVETVLRNIYNEADVEEWFNYGGSPYTFRVKINIRNGGLTESEIKTVDEHMKFYKNIRSHCDKVFYNMINRVTKRTVSYLTVKSILRIKAKEN